MTSLEDSFAALRGLVAAYPETGSVALKKVYPCDDLELLALAATNIIAYVIAEMARYDQTVAQGGIEALARDLTRVIAVIGPSQEPKQH